jgi:hypothetical protein
MPPVELRGDEAGLPLHESGVRRPGLLQSVRLLGLDREGVDEYHRAYLLLLHLLEERDVPVHLDQLRHILPPPGGWHRRYEIMMPVGAPRRTRGRSVHPSACKDEKNGQE